MALGCLVAGLMGGTPAHASPATSGDDPCYFFTKDDQYSTPPGTALQVTDPGVLANDSDCALWVVTSTSAPTHGQLAAFDFTGSIYDPFDPGEPGHGGFTYTPDPGFTGVDTFTYVILNSPSVDESTVTIYVGVQPPSHPVSTMTAVTTSLVVTTAPTPIAPASTPLRGQAGFTG